MKKQGRVRYGFIVGAESTVHCGPATIGGEDTLGPTLAKAFFHVAFFLREDYGYPAVTLSLSEFCGECGGSGVIQGKRCKQRKCKFCDGAGELRVLVEKQRITREGLGQVATVERDDWKAWKAS